MNRTPLQKGFPCSRFRFGSGGGRNGRSPKSKFTTGFTLAELVIAIAILVVVGLAVSTFQKDVFSLAFNFQGNLDFQLGARAMLKSFTSEAREASPSSVGSYPIEEASTSEFIFYSDMYNDGKKERIRYFLSGTDFKKGITIPTGSPLSYNIATEKTSTLLSNVSNGTSSIFEYYDTNYTGTSSPLSQPVDITSIRLVKATIYAKPDARSSSSEEFTTEVSIRNLKDNL
ncbi:MAG TPA: prepilin-type N-terminal cleavage/methylation domain-containing protein [Candidatus Paceibacterota bacterium]|jgi:hypothetical protein|nr:prepilin-type N-terminal cleavage/methylation domain-containing protein [Candidatus Paceibacterota bacterium]